jgi:membrane protein DedA with SNARE-associated domain
MDTILDWITRYGYLALFCVLMLGIVGLPFPDDLILAFAGYLVSQGYLKPLPTVTYAFFGSVCGITVSYALGRALGLTLLERHGGRVGITRGRLESTKSWYARFGGWTLLIGYFVGGIRHLSALAAGMSEMRPYVFATFAYAGALLWSITLISTGYFLGEGWAKVGAYTDNTALTIAVLILLMIFSWLVHERLRRNRALPAKSPVVKES